jgi:hypothetical protein
MTSGKESAQSHAEETLMKSTATCIVSAFKSASVCVPSNVIMNITNEIVLELEVDPVEVRTVRTKILKNVSGMEDISHRKEKNK